MSEWYIADIATTDIDWKQKEVDILVTSNNSGNVYVSLTFQQIEDIYNAMQSHEHTA